MKKRLLSALLALVMVLAMLPATAFAADDTTGNPPADSSQTDSTPGTPDADPADPADTPPAPAPANPAPKVSLLSEASSAQNGWSTKVITKTDAAYDIGLDDIGKYAAYGQEDDGTGKKVTKYYIIQSGFVYSNRYYNSLNDLPTSVVGNLTSNITSIGSGSSGTIPDRITSAVIEIFSGDLAITGHTKLTSLTVKNSKNTGTQPTVTLASCDNLASLTLENVDGSAGININESTPAVNNTRTIKLTNAKIGAITMNGKGTYTDSNGKSTAVDKGRTIQATNSDIGAISLTGSNSQVKLTDCRLGTNGITVHSNGGSISIDGHSTVGDIEIGTLDAKKTLPTITIGGTTTTGSIDQWDSCPSLTTATANITINGAGAHVATTNGTITFNSANITISAGHAGYITLNQGGKLALNGSYINVNGVSLNGTAQFAVNGSYNAANSNSGAHNTVGGFYVISNNVSLTIPNDPTNTFGAGDPNLDSLAAYKKQNILGGTWKFDVPASALSTTLVYYLVDNAAVATEWTYYTSAQLGAALNKQIEGDAGGARVRVTGQDYTKGIGEVRFMNGATSWGVLQVTDPMQIILPDMINNVKLTSWTDGAHTYTLPSVYTVPTVDLMPNTGAGDTKYVELNASGGVNTGDVTKLTKVAASAVTDYVGGSVRAELNGNVISLSGAVNPGTSMITLTLTTDAVEKKTEAGVSKDVPVELDVGVTYFSGTKSLTFENKGTTALGKGMTLETDASGLGVLRLSNGTKYTLNGSGLKVRSQQIKVAGYDADVYGITDYSHIEVSVNAPTIKTEQDKQTIIDMFTGTNGDFDWTNSPAMKQAINAALATITDQQVDNWLAQVQREAWTKVNTGTYNAAANATESGYDTVWLVPYLQVNVTGYSTNGTMTFTAVPSWRVEVRQSAPKGNAYDTAFFDAKKPENNLTNPKSAKVVKAGTSLGALTGNMGDTDDLTKGVTLKITHGFAGTYLHQDNTYTYNSVSGTATTITHAGNNGLGTLVINKDAPLVTLYKSNTVSADVVAYYDTLQAAVDDAKDQQHIVVDQNYKGSMTINVTGTARTFTIQGNGNNVVVSNTNNGLVTLNSTGGLYTVQLTRDATAVGGTTADISVASGITNGTVTLSTTRAKANTKVEVTTTPAAGYLTRNLTATARTADNKNTTVAVTKTADNKYTFTVPTGATSITVTPTFAINTGMPFTDVEASDPYFEAVKYVYEHNPQLMNGMTATSFGGYGTITRGQVVTILYRLSGSPSVSSYSGFTDVNTSKYYAAPITWARNNGIVDGYGTTFGPEDPITREQLAKILHDYSVFRGLNVSKTTSLNGYTDAGYVHSWALEGMQWSVANGIVGGTTTTTLSPGNSAQRYHAATMLMRYCKEYGL